MTSENMLVKYGFSVREPAIIGPIAANFYGTVMKTAVFPRVYGASWEHHRYFIKFIYERIRGRRVLELGVGSGETADLLPADNAYAGVDRSPALLSVASRKFRRAGFPEPRFCRGPVEDLLFRDGSFDYALCSLTLAHTNDPMAAVGEAARVLADGGELIGCEPVPERSRAATELPGTPRSAESLEILFGNSGFTFEPLDFENGSLLYFLARNRPGSPA